MDTSVICCWITPFSSMIFGFLVALLRHYENNKGLALRNKIALKIAICIFALTTMICGYLGTVGHENLTCEAIIFIDKGLIIPRIAGALFAFAPALIGQFFVTGIYLFGMFIHEGRSFNWNMEHAVPAFICDILTVAATISMTIYYAATYGMVVPVMYALIIFLSAMIIPAIGLPLLIVLTIINKIVSWGVGFWKWLTT